MKSVGLCLAHRKYTCMLSFIINGYNFGQGGCSSTRSTLSGCATDSPPAGMGKCCKNPSCFAAIYVDHKT